VAITFVQSASGTTNADPVPITLPTGWQANDVCYIVAQTGQSDNAMTTLAGWTLVANAGANSTNQMWVRVYRRVLQNGDSNPSFANPSHPFIAWTSVAFRGADTTTPEDVTPSTSTTTSATLTPVATGVTTVTAGCALISAFTTASSGGTSTPPSGETELTDVSFGALHEVNYEILGPSTIGATGNKTSTVTQNTGLGTSGYSSVLLAVRPLIPFIPSHGLVVAQAVKRASSY
jgi:hypothetical protein